MGEFMLMAREDIAEKRELELRTSREVEGVEVILGSAGNDFAKGCSCS
jgi:hypothetical protein